MNRDLSKTEVDDVARKSNSRMKTAMAKVCDNCPLCNYARSNPDTTIGKVMEWHGKFCPAWKAQKDL